MGVADAFQGQCVTVRYGRGNSLQDSFAGTSATELGICVCLNKFRHMGIWGACVCESVSVWVGV